MTATVSLLRRSNSILKKHRHSILLICIISIAVLTRFWKLTSLFHWLLDEEYWAYVSHNIATGYHFPLIGGPISGTGLYLGPFFVWLTGLVFWLIGSSPVRLAFVLSGTGVLVVWLVINLFKKITDSKTALIAGFFYGASTLATLYDRKFWNASPIPLFSVLAVYLIHKLKESPSTKIALTLSLILSLAFHSHATGSALIIFSLVALFVYKVPKKTLATIALSFIFLQAPLVLFDLRHDFTNTKALIKLVTSSSTSATNFQKPLIDATTLTVNTFARLIYTPATDISNELTLCTQFAHSRSQPSLPIKALTITLLIYAVLQLKRKNPFSLLLFTNIALIFAYRILSPENFYPGQLSEYYFLPSFVAFLVLAAKASLKLYSQVPIIAVSLVLLLVTSNLHTTLNLTHTDSFQSKQRIVNQALAQLGNSPFTLDVQGHQCLIYGYRYLFTLSGHEPVASYLDPSFGWLYQRRLPTNTPTKHLLIDADSATIKITNKDETLP